MGRSQTEFEDEGFGAEGLPRRVWWDLVKIMKRDKTATVVRVLARWLFTGCEAGLTQVKVFRPTGLPLARGPGHCALPLVNSLYSGVGLG